MDMNTIISIFFGAMLAQNLVLVGMLGLDLFAASTSKAYSALRIGCVFGVSSLIATAGAYALNSFVLLPLGLMAVKYVAFAVIIVLVTIASTAYISLKMPELKKTMGIYLPLVTANSAVFALMLNTSAKEYSFGTSLIVSLGASVGFLIVSLIFSSVRERIEYAECPKAFKGFPIMMVSAALLYLAFMGFVGSRF